MGGGSHQTPHWALCILPGDAPGTGIGARYYVRQIFVEIIEAGIYGGGGCLGMYTCEICM